MSDTEQAEAKIREKLIGTVPPEQEHQMTREISELAKILIEAYRGKKL